MKKTRLAWGCAILAAGCAWAVEWPEPVAHRGGAREFDENTLAAFQGSHAKGLRAFETDIRMTRDGALVLMHDGTVTRTTGAEGAVETMTADEVRTLRTKKTGAPVPFLDDLLGFFADKEGVVLQLELKTNKKQYPDNALDEYCRKVHKAVTARLPAKAFRYSSFDRRALEAMRRAAPEAALIILGGPCGEERVKEARGMGIGAISCKLKGTTREAVEAARRAGLTVGGYGAATLQDYRVAAELGLAFVTTDCPVEVNAWRNAQDAGR
jgi:glycerophosphoryl diester phosphodiesterase